MVRRDDVNRFARAARLITGAAVDDLNQLLDAVAGLPPDQARDELLAMLPELVDYHGDALAAVAAQWYEQIRAAPGAYRAVLADPFPSSQVEGTVRYASKFLFDEQLASARNVLAGAMQRWIMYSGRETVARNVRLDPSKPRFARVPVGETCAWCDMLASRGWVYHSKETAGINGGYHDHCNCQIVPSWDAGRVHLEGYDPDELYKRYTTARHELEGDGLRVTGAAVVERMKDLYNYPDSPEVPSVLRSAAQGWPGEVMPVTPGVWRHIIKRHGPDGVTASKFGANDNYTIAKAIRDCVRDPDAILSHREWRNIENRFRVIDNELIVVGIKNTNGVKRVKTAFPPLTGSRIMEEWKQWNNSVGRGS